MSHIQKDHFLTKKVIPLDVKTISNIDDLLKSLKNCGFQGRKLGIALYLIQNG